MLRVVRALTVVPGRAAPARCALRPIHRWNAARVLPRDPAQIKTVVEVTA